MQKKGKSVKCGETLLTRTSKKFTLEIFKKIKNFKNPTKKTRNVILAFLTFFHDHLDYLVEDSTEDQKKNE